MSNIFNTDSVTLFNIYFDKKTKTNKLKKTYLINGVDRKQLEFIEMGTGFGKNYNNS